MAHEIPVRCYGVAVVIIRTVGRKSETLLLKRAARSNGQWCQVAGGIEEGETAWQAALREVREETSLVPEKLYSSDLLENFYEVDKNAIWIAPVFVAYVAADAKVVLNHEHTEYEWVSLIKAIKTLPFPGQRKIMNEVKEEFVDKKAVELLRIRTTE